MGSSADATIAWGVEIFNTEGDEDYEESERLSECWEEWDYDWIDTALGWTEPFPSWPDKAIQSAHDSPERKAHQAAVDAYHARRVQVVCIEGDHYGDTPHDMTGKLLVFTRTKTTVDWGCDEVDPSSLAQPTWAERNAMDILLNKLEFKGDRTPKLLIYACYG